MILQATASPWLGFIGEMADALALRQIFSLENAAWVGVALCFLFIARMWNGAPAMFQQWIAYRKAVAEEKQAHWVPLLAENKRLDERCIRLEKAEERCRDELMDVKGRISVLEGYQIGKGQLRQELTIIEATERLSLPKDKP